MQRRLGKRPDKVWLADSRGRKVIQGEIGCGYHSLASYLRRLLAVGHNETNDKGEVYGFFLLKLLNMQLFTKLSPRKAYPPRVFTLGNDGG